MVVQRAVRKHFLERCTEPERLEIEVVTVTITDDQFLHIGAMNFTAKVEMQYRWTVRQKQEWAAYVMRVLLRQEDQEYAY